MTNKSEYPLVFKDVLVESDEFGNYYVDGEVRASSDIFGDCPLFKGTWFNFNILDYCGLCKFHNKDSDKEFRAKAIAALIQIHNDWVELRKSPEPMNVQGFRYCYE